MSMQKENGGFYFSDGDAGKSAARTGGPGEPSKRGNIRGRWFFILILIVMPLTAFSFVAGSVFLYRLYETLPTHTQLQNVEQALVSKVLDKDGKLIHEFSVERRFWVSLDQIPVDLQNAVIAIEDRRFYNHWGINVERNIGAILANLDSGRFAQGASTITQQLARNLYLTSDKTIIRKIREVLTAAQLERSYTKKEILELYLNQVYLGAGVYGVQAASQHYFNKNVSDLTLSESAIIAGIIQLPERHRPDRQANSTRITARRNAVLRSMVIIGAISDAAARAAIAEPVAANPKVYLPPKAPYFMEMVRRYVAEKYGDEQLYNGGLVIHTTLDTYAQDSIERSMARQIESLQRRLNWIFLSGTNADRKIGISREAFIADFDSLYALNAEEYGRLHDTLKLRRAQIGVVAIEVSTGAIRALVGGRDFQESRFNRVTQARRQAGSAFKPFVYSAALRNGFTPATVVLDQPITLITPEGEWRPENYDRTFAGPMSIRSALARSNNLVAIQVFNKVGGQTVVDHAKNMGIKQTLHTGPSLAIGACEVTPLEITSSYGVYANRGIHTETFFVQKIVTRNGRVLEQTVPKERQAISPPDAFLMSSMLGQVVCCGTGASIRSTYGFKRPAGGKTGTTNDYADAWFIGFTPQIVCGVWTGVDERLSMGRGVTGSVAAIPVWAAAMHALHKDLPVEDFRRPEGIRQALICAQTSGLSKGACPVTKGEYFRNDMVVDTCTVHGVAASLRGGGIDIFGPSRRSSGIGGGEPAKRRSFIF